MANSGNSIAGPLGRLGRSAGMLALAAIVAAALTTFVGRADKPAGNDSFYGMVVGPQVDVDRAIPKLSALGVHTVRLRMSVKDWSRPAANTGSDAYDGALEQAPKLDEKGFRVVLQVDSEGGAMPSYARAKALFSWLMDRPGAKSVDVVEVLGPVTETASDADAFSTTLSRAEQARRYVDGPLKAAWEVVHRGKHKKVLGAAFTPYQQSADGRATGSGNLSVTQAYVKAGYLDRVDYAGFHPDQPTVAQQEAWVKKATEVLGRKPVWVSEWQLNRQAYPNDGAYLNAMSQTLTSLRGRLGTACYSGFTEQEGTVPVTQGGLGGYRENDPAFQTYRDWPKKK
ncbi:MAG TPA: hypothetical protein VI357_11285 [Mycobacteriales bacterium]